MSAVKVVRLPFLFALVSGLALISSVGAPPAARAQEQIKLTPQRESLAFAFGWDRSSKDKTIILSASRALGRRQKVEVVRLGDFTPEEGSQSLPDGIVKAKTRIVQRDRSLIRLTITVDLDGVSVLQAGDYAGSLRIKGGGIEPLTLPISVSMQSGWPWLALIVIVLGLIVGAVFKWNSEVGAKLGPLQRRYGTLRRQLLESAPDLPTGLAEDMRRLDEALAQWDAATGTEKADAIEKNLDGVLRVIRLAKQTQAEVDAHRTLLEEAGASAGLASIPDREVRRVRNALDQSWPEPSQGEETMKTLASQVALVTWMVRTDLQRYEPALRRFAQDRFEEGADKAKEIADQESQKAELMEALAARAAHEAPAPTVAAAPARRRRFRLPGSKGSRRGFIFQYLLPWGLGGVGAGLIAAVGFQSEYLKEATFGFGGFGDWLSLFLWGFAAGFSGKGVHEYVQQRSGAEPAGR